LETFLLAMKKIFATLLGTLWLCQLNAQQVLMQGWYWDYPKTAAGYSWADTLRLKAANLKKAGITHMWFPPHTIASFGPGSNGYDPKDLFIGNQTSGLGSRAALDAMLAEFTAQGIAPVADMVYNHRDGGAPEVNPAVKEYITNYTSNKNPFPSDRFRCILPLGGSSGNGAGNYYFKISSVSGDDKFKNFRYKLYMETKTRGWQGLSDVNEVEPNGGGDCGQGNNSIQLGRNVWAQVDDPAGCRTDEFHLNLSASDFNPAGDTLYIYLANEGNYSDHRIYGIWSGPRGRDVANEILYQTYTDYSNMPSGRGQMNYEFFKPNSANQYTTHLSGDWDGMYFFYDYDQFQARTRDTLINWTKWNWTELGVRGLRMDAIKHFNPGFVSDLLNSMHADGMNPSMVVGEWYGTNTSELSGWVNDVLNGMTASAKAAIQPKIFDFSLRDNLRLACDDAGFDTRHVFNSSLRDAAGMSGFNIVTFVNNHDFRDGDGFASLIKNNPELGYAYILTNNQLGVPTIFYPDYYGYPAPSGGLYAYHPANQAPLQGELNRLLQALKLYINGAPSVDYLNRFSTPYSSNFIEGSSNRALIYQLQGSEANGNKEVIVAINFGSTPLRVDHQINTRGGSILSGTRFSDVLGKSAHPYALVDGSNRIYMDLPAKSYSIWVQGTESVLPLKLLSFTARAVEQTVRTTWSVTDNQEALRFEVERAHDGENFRQIGVIPAVATSGTATYSFTDRQPVLNTAMVYRLKIIFKSGKEQYSNLQPARINASSVQLKLVQNPVKGQLKIEVVTKEGSQAQATIIDSRGAVLLTKKYTLRSGGSLLQVPVGQLAAGAYQLLIKVGDVQQVLPFIKD